jgi:hypothetical protein
MIKNLLAQDVLEMPHRARLNLICEIGVNVGAWDEDQFYVDLKMIKPKIRKKNIELLLKDFEKKLSEGDYKRANWSKVQALLFMVIDKEPNYGEFAVELVFRLEAMKLFDKGGLNWSRRCNYGRFNSF